MLEQLTYHSQPEFSEVVVINICKEQNLWATISQFQWLVILNKKCYAA